MTEPNVEPRQIPVFRQHILKPKTGRYALVIPVINEGERIRRQVQKIAALHLGVDVIIADGGSTDGSLDLRFLAEQRVTALLVKEGSGRHGAQLRIAFAHCLDEGYDGIVTVDGNDKDGLEAIPVFIAKLDQGFGYVQGSRYRPGGRAINTPWDRVFGGRFIHAPLISLAARRWYTDTTNGFRAYSRAYLADPRTAIFRDVFDLYSLLFYLSVRASRLGYQTCEIPVERRYPADVPTPTKIAGLFGRVHMIGELLAVVTGQLNPPSR